MEAAMKALVYQGSGKKEWKDVPDAAIKEPTDAVVRVDTTTICGTDLHILQGDVAAVTEGPRWSSGPATSSRPAPTLGRTSSGSPTVSASTSRSRPSATRRRC